VEAFSKRTGLRRMSNKSEEMIRIKDLPERNSTRATSLTTWKQRRQYYSSTIDATWKHQKIEILTGAQTMFVLNVSVRRTNVFGAFGGLKRFPRKPGTLF